MRLLDLEMRNFKTVVETQKLDLAARGLVCIVGENGVGKTTIADAILWCLFGRTLVGAKGNDVVNERTNKNCHVKVSFEDNHGSLWHVDRYRKSRKHRNRLYLRSVNTMVDKSQHLVEDTEKEIEKLLGLDFTAFMTATIVGQGLLAPFSSMSTLEQSRIIDVITGNDVLQTALEVTRKRKNLLHDELEAELGERDRILGAIAEFREDIAQAEAKAAKATAQRKAQLREAQKQEAQARDRMHLALKQQEEAKSDKKHIANLEAEHDELDDRAQALRTRKGALEADGLRVVRRLRHYETKQAGVECKECGAKVTKANLDRIVKALRAEFEQYKVAYDKIDRRLEKTKKEYEAVNTELMQLNEDHQKRLNVEQERASYKKAINWRKDIEQLANTWAQAVEQPQKRLKQYKALLARQKTMLRKHKRNIRYLEHIEQEYARGIPLDIQDTVLPFLNSTANKYSQIITDGSVDIEFATEKTNKSGTTKEGICVLARNHQGSGKYKLQSKGEKQKIDIVVASALQELSMETAHANVNLVIYDEPFDALDAASTERVMQFLQEELTRRESVFVITHNTSLQSNFSNVVEVTKQHGASVIRDGQ